MTDFFFQTASLMSLLFIGSGVVYFAKKLRLPLSACLVASGIIIAFISNVPYISFLDDFELTNNILFYALLPVLLFDSGYNMKYRDLIDNRYSIFSLSTISLLLSAFFISLLLYFGASLIGFPIPYIVTLLFGSLISATDTAAALSAFKEIGVRKRLTTIFEGESLFNDGTAIALFIVVLSILQSSSLSSEYIVHQNILQVIFSYTAGFFGNTYVVVNGAFTLISMVIFGAIIGSVVGIIFSKIIEKVEDETYLEIALTFTLAHATFLIAEGINYYLLPASGIIATVMSALLIGNYGRYKLSPKVETVMEKYWGFFSYVSNLLIFILVGILLVQLNVHWKPLIILIIITIPIVVGARFFSVFPVFKMLNALKKEDYIDKKWQFILSWGALRGVMALMMVLLIPQNMQIEGWEHYPMTIRDVLLALTVGVIAFSVFVKSLSLPYFIKKTGVNQMSLTEKILFLFEKIILLESSIKKIERTITGRYIDREEGLFLKEHYENILRETQIRLEEEKKDPNFTTSLKKVLIIHALSFQLKHLKNIYKRKEVDEQTFKKILKKIEYSMRETKRGNLKIQNTQNITIPKNILENLFLKILIKIDIQFEDSIEKRYYEMRTFHMILEKSLEALEDFKRSTTLITFSEIDEIIEKYTEYDSEAEEKRQVFFARHRTRLRKLSRNLTQKSLKFHEEIGIEERLDASILSPRLAQELLQELKNI